MSLRIIKKRWDNPKSQIITHLEIEGQKIYPMISVWNFINDKKGTCHTFEDGVRAEVYAKTKDNGTKYTTTSRDGTTKNNLDELPNC